MKRLMKLSAIGTALLLTAAFASADTIQLGSYGTGQPTMGNQNTALVFTGTPSTTYDIGNGGIWTAALSGSSWVSQNPGNAPGGNNVEPNGIYQFTTTFNLTNANYSGSIMVMADDTTDVWLNGNLVQTFAGGGNSTCQISQPNCIVPLSVALPFGDFLTGTNTLTFNVHQIKLDAEGLDFAGSVSTVPEPGSLMLLGTGLLGLAGELTRRMKSRS